jgi:hypothetical protein
MKIASITLLAVAGLLAGGFIILLVMAYQTLVDSQYASS